MTTSARGHVELSHAGLPTTLSTLVENADAYVAAGAQHLILGMGPPFELKPLEALLTAARKEWSRGGVSPSAAG